MSDLPANSYQHTHDIAAELLQIESSVVKVRKLINQREQAHFEEAKKTPPEPTHCFFHAPYYGGRLHGCDKEATMSVEFRKPIVSGGYAYTNGFICHACLQHVLSQTQEDNDLRVSVQSLESGGRAWRRITSTR